MLADSGWFDIAIVSLAILGLHLAGIPPDDGYFGITLAGEYSLPESYRHQLAHGQSSLLFQAVAVLADE